LSILDMVTLPNTAGVRVVCVSGMHRSGTSIVARLVQILGVSLGSLDELLEAGPDNTAGYWEHAAIKELDDEVLAALGGSWDQLPVLEPGWADSSTLDPFRTRARAILGATFGDVHHGIVGFKDPRLSILLPFWRTVADIDTSIVLVRDPDEVSRSLAKRNGFTEPHSSLLWLRYLLAAITNDPGHLLLTQTEIFSDLPGTLKKLAEHLDLPAPSTAMLDDATAHLQPELRHHHSVARLSTEADPLTQMALRVWNGGQVDLDALGAEVRTALVEGWLRDPGDAEQLAVSRAQVVALTEEIRQRNRERDATVSWQLRLRARRLRRWVEERTGG
jgi:hypothetical protein